MATDDSQNHIKNRNRALIHAIVIPIVSVIVLVHLNRIVGVVQDSSIERLMEVATLACMVVVAFGCVGQMAIAMHAHQRAAKSKTESHYLDSSKINKLSIRGFLSNINSALPNFSFGTYRHVNSKDVSGESACECCGNSATVAREYRDSTVRFGMTFGATSPKTVTYCDECCDAEGVVCEGWIGD